MIDNSARRQALRLAGRLAAVVLPSLFLIHLTIPIVDLTTGMVETSGLQSYVAWRGLLLLAGVYGYLITSWLDLAPKQKRWRTGLFGAQWAAFTTIGGITYLITGDTTLLWLAGASLLLLLSRRVSNREVVILTSVLLLNLPTQVGRWYQANRDLPMPTSEQVREFEKQQSLVRQQRVQAARFREEGNTAALANYHARVWIDRLVSDLQTGRWSGLLGMVLLGLLIRRSAFRQRWSEQPILRDSLFALGGLWVLMSLLEIISGRNYVATLKLFSNSLQYPGYYIFDVPDALYLTVAETANLVTAVLVGVGLWFLSWRLRTTGRVRLLRRWRSVGRRSVEAGEPTAKS